MNLLTPQEMDLAIRNFSDRIRALEAQIEELQKKQPTKRPAAPKAEEK